MESVATLDGQPEPHWLTHHDHGTGPAEGANTNTRHSAPTAATATADWHIAPAAPVGTRDQLTVPGEGDNTHDPAGATGSHDRPIGPAAGVSAQASERVRSGSVSGFRPALGGLYATKPAFQRRLARTADWLAALGVHPDVLTYAAVACGVLGGLALTAGLAQPKLLWVVPPLAGVRLALNALDGMVATRRNLARPWGKVLNELADRLADLAFLGPLLLVPGASAPLVTAALCATLLVSYLGVLAETAGAGRQYGGLMGKPDRMLWLSLASAASAATGSLLPLRVLPAVLLLGGLVTLVQRGGRAHAAI